MKTAVKAASLEAPSPARLVASIVKASCDIEVLSPKVGNVHLGARFDDTDCDDFLQSAHAIAPVMGRADRLGLGQTVLQSVRATRRAVGRNTNLGIILLLAPLALAAHRVASRDADSRRCPSLRAAVKRTLAEATPKDAQAIYRAIALAAPGGLGRAEKGDVVSREVLPIGEAMALAAGRDQVARQWANGFEDVFDWLLPTLEKSLASLPRRPGAAGRRAHLLEAVALTHLSWLAREPETLIARKCGMPTARRAMARAQAALAAGAGSTAWGRRKIDALDRWLRADGNRRNPGTSADLLAATLFVWCWKNR